MSTKGEICLKRSASVLSSYSLLLSRAGYLPQNVPLQMISYLSQESEFLPWHAASRALYQLDKLLDRTEDHSLFSVSLISHQFGVCCILTLTSAIRKTQLISGSTSQMTRQIELKTSSDHHPKQQSTMFQAQCLS